MLFETCIYNRQRYLNGLSIGPGNNGADGLVAARHLFSYGYKPSLLIAKEFPPISLNNSLLNICLNMGIKLVTGMKEGDKETLFLVDAILGKIRRAFIDI